MASPGGTPGGAKSAQNRPNLAKFGQIGHMAKNPGGVGVGQKSEKLSNKVKNATRDLEIGADSARFWQGGVNSAKFDHSGLPPGGGQIGSKSTILAPPGVGQKVLKIEPKTAPKWAPKWHPNGLPGEGKFLSNFAA